MIDHDFVYIEGAGRKKTKDGKATGKKKKPASSDEETGRGGTHSNSASGANLNASSSGGGQGSKKKKSKVNQEKETRKGGAQKVNHLHKHSHNYHKCYLNDLVCLPGRMNAEYTNIWINRILVCILSVFSVCIWTSSFSFHACSIINITNSCKAYRSLTFYFLNPYIEDS